LFFVKKLTKINRCVSEFSWKRNQILVPHFAVFYFWPHSSGDEWCQCAFLYLQ